MEARGGAKGSSGDVLAANMKSGLKGSPAKKGRPQATKGTAGKHAQTGRANQQESASKQATTSPLKGAGPSFGKYGNAYAGEASDRKVVAGKVAQASGIPETAAHEGLGADAAAAAQLLNTINVVFESCEINEVLDGETSINQLFAKPSENIDDITMPVPGLEAPQKKGGISTTKLASRASKQLAPANEQARGSARHVNAKKETKYIAISLSNEHLLEPPEERAGVIVSQEIDISNLHQKYQTQVEKDTRSDLRDMLYENPYRDGSEQESECLDQEAIDEGHELDPADMLHIAGAGPGGAGEEPLAKEVSLGENSTGMQLAEEPAAVVGLDKDHGDHAMQRLQAFVQSRDSLKDFQSDDQQAPGSESAHSQEEATFPMSVSEFLEIFRDRMLEEEIKELEEGRDSIKTVYFAGSIPLRSPDDVAMLEALAAERVAAFNTNKAEASEGTDGELHGNPVFDNFEGYYKVQMGEHLAYRYEILKVLGKGSFAQVVQCRDRKSSSEETFAVKITRNTEMDHKFAHKEAQYLRYIMQEDPHDKYNIVRMLDQCTFREHHCFVFELLHTDLFEHLKATGFVGFSTDKIRDYAVQILKGLVFLEKHKIIHCDLKPENILCADAVCRSLKIVDFGSGCFRDEQIYTYVQSRFYRSPEVILRIKYTEKVDIWSLGCILAELYTGEPLFPGNNEQEQLELIMELSGMPPETMIDKSRKKEHYFDTDYSPFLIEDEELGILRIPNSRTLREAVPCEDAEFLDFVMNCLEIDPERRFSASEAMEHPWVKAALRDSLRARKL